MPLYILCFVKYILDLFTLYMGQEDSHLHTTQGKASLDLLIL